MTNPKRIKRGRYWLHWGRRIERQQPAGDLYWRKPYRLAYLHPVPSIRVWLIGPAYIALSVDPRKADAQ